MIIGANCSCMGRTLDKFIQPAILMLLYKKEMHGFVLIQEMGKTPLFSKETPDPSGIYRYLKKMEHRGLLVSHEQEQEGLPSKRIYKITDEGRQCLEHWTQTLEEYAQQVSDLTAQLRQTLSE